MKALPVILLNVATVAVALVAYDVVRSAPADQDAGVESGSIANADTGTDALEERIRALETERRPSRRAAASDARILDRLAALESALQVETPVGGNPAAAETSGSTAPAAPATGDATPSVDEWSGATASSEEPRPAEVRRFRALREAVRREDAVQRNKTRVDVALDKLPLNLTQEQRKQIHRAFAAFEPRIGEIWTEAKSQAQQTIAAGGEVDRATIVADTTAVIQQEFTVTLTGTLPHADAQTVAEALLAKGR